LFWIETTPRCPSEIILAVRLQTARLVLRPPREQDVDAFAEAATDPEVMRFIGNGGVGTRDGSLQAIQRYIRFWGEDSFGMFAVERRDDGVVVGRTGLQAWEPGDWHTGSRTEIGALAEIEIGWILARRHWRCGYATEAALAVREWALGELRLPRLVSLIAPGNQASIHVAEKIGETYERYIVTGAGNDAHLYAVNARR
jgi:RimJ/RimL family protein N-acetyltransferase